MWRSLSAPHIQRALGGRPIHSALFAGATYTARSLGGAATTTAVGNLLVHAGFRKHIENHHTGDNQRHAKQAHPIQFLIKC